MKTTGRRQPAQSPFGRRAVSLAIVFQMPRIAFDCSMLHFMDIAICPSRALRLSHDCRLHLYESGSSFLSSPLTLPVALRMICSNRDW